MPFSLHQTPSTTLLEADAALHCCPQAGLGVETVLREWHPDAEIKYNLTMDLHAVIVELQDPNFRMQRRVLLLITA